MHLSALLSPLSVWSLLQQQLPKGCQCVPAPICKERFALQTNVQCILKNDKKTSPKKAPLHFHSFGNDATVRPSVWPPSLSRCQQRPKFIPPTGTTEELRGKSKGQLTQNGDLAQEFFVHLPLPQRAALLSEEREGGGRTLHKVFLWFLPTAALFFPPSPSKSQAQPV